MHVTYHIANYLGHVWKEMRCPSNSEEEYEASLERLPELSSLFKDGREEEDGRNVSFFFLT